MDLLKIILLTKMMLKKFRREEMITSVDYGELEIEMNLCSVHNEGRHK